MRRRRLVVQRIPAGPALHLARQRGQAEEAHQDEAAHQLPGDCHQGVGARWSEVPQQSRQAARGEHSTYATGGQAEGKGPEGW